MSHPALADSRPAVITGAASGIGLAAAKKFASLGMWPIHMIDRDKSALDRAVAEVKFPAGHAGAISAWNIDVSDIGELEKVRDDILRGNRPIGVNLWGVINGVHTFAPMMIEQTTPSIIINTGSKQGITSPPGDTAYNVSKAGVKVLTEGLAHQLRNTEGCQVTAHLLVPGFVWTGMTARGGRTEKPAGAWTPEETVDHMLARLEAADFYILCPDNDVTPEMDRKRIAWAAGDLIENRPALSRWHPDYKDAFDKFMAGG